MDWVEIGEVWVDAGVIWIGDPCYVITEDAKYPPKTWSEFCNMSSEAGLFSRGYAETLGTGLGIELLTAYGDGTYPVFVQKNEDGRTSKVMIDFEPAPDETDDES